MVYILGIMVDSNVSREAEWLARNEPVDLDGREDLYAALIDELAPIVGEIVIEKPGKGAFYATVFGDELKKLGTRQLVFAGVTTEVCVQTTMREANDRGYECLLAEDATESYFPEFKASAIAMIRAQGAIVGWTTPVDKILEGLANA